jgi:hypothetical protein
MSEAIKRASFAIEDMKDGGGNLWGSAGPVKATIRGGKFTKQAPEGYTADGNPIYAVPVFELAGDGPVEERTVDQSFSMGAQSGDNFTISEDGDYLIPNSDDSHIVKDCKFGIFASSLQNEGVPKTVLADFAFSKIAGLEGDFKRIVDKERSFVADKPGQKKKFPPSTLCLVKLHKLAGEVGKSTTAGTASSKATAGSTSASLSGSASTVVSTGDLDADTLEYVKTVLAAGPVQRGRLTLKVSKIAAENPDRQALARRAGEESFIQEMAGLGQLTYAAAEKGQPVSLAA